MKRTYNPCDKCPRGIDLRDGSGSDYACRICEFAKLRTLGPVEELFALVKARDEGRVVVLPCKVGDVVYALGYQSIRELTICSCARIGCCAEDENGKLDYLGYDVFGKTVFLTRAEAEGAIGGGGDG